MVVVAGLLVFSAACDKKESAAEGGAATAKTDTPTQASAKPKGPEVASCMRNMKVDGRCDQWGAKNIEAAGIEMLEGLCKNDGEKFDTKACPTEKLIGSCATQEKTSFYYEGEVATALGGAEGLAKDCPNAVPAGTWKAAP